MRDGLGREVYPDEATISGSPGGPTKKPLLAVFFMRDGLGLEVYPDEATISGSPGGPTSYNKASKILNLEAFFI